ncbi:MAG: DUF1587 domain-containing protein [Deltaproteobacteria bacterium]
MRLQGPFARFQTWFKNPVAQAFSSARRPPLWLDSPGHARVSFPAYAGRQPQLDCRRTDNDGSAGGRDGSAGSHDWGVHAAAPAAVTRLHPHLSLVNEYCLSCHDDERKKGGLSLEAIAGRDIEDQKKGELSLEVIAGDDIAQHPDVWEKVVRKLRARQMPPVGRSRPNDATYEATISYLVKALDRAAEAHPNPGRTATIRRLTRTEYHNAVRDLLALDEDVTSLLPGDESSYGFDNVTVGDLSPTLLDRYVSTAEKISQLAIGSPSRSPGGDTIRVQTDLTQEEHLPGLPIGTRGGALVPYNFPREGEYDIRIRLTRDRNEHVEGLNDTHELELLLDGARVQLFTVKPPPHAAAS